jgi:hypothetical protein
MIPHVHHWRAALYCPAGHEIASLTRKCEDSPEGSLMLAYELLDAVKPCPVCGGVEGNWRILTTRQDDTLESGRIM